MVEELGIGEDTQMVTHRGLTESHSGGEITDARGALRLGTKEGEDAQSGRVSHRLEQASEFDR
jgi:hypothetical protein